MKSLLKQSAFILILIAAIACFGLTVIANTNLQGDVDLNGVVNVRDATLIQRSIAGLSTLTEEAEKIADVDLSGAVNIKDATMIQKFVASIITSFPTEEPTSTATENTSVSTDATDSTNPTDPTENTTAIPTEPTTLPSTTPTTVPSVTSEATTAPSTTSAPIPPTPTQPPFSDPDGGNWSPVYKP